ncbi:MAG TPA: anti-sigma factor, partial [Candidatus Binataceae bacterium]|nr:anti-sigma factor [Candidatus Binataceae bacterium]
MDHQRLQELLPLAALERLDGDEQQAVDDHLADGCHDCFSELRSFKDSLAALAMVAEEAPDNRIWNRLELRLRTAGDETRPAQNGQMRPAQNGAIVAAASNGNSYRSVAAAYRARQNKAHGETRQASAPVATRWKVTASIAGVAAAAMALFAYSQSVQLTASTTQFRHEIAKLNGQLGESTTQLAAANGQVALLSDELEDRVRLSRILLSPDGLRVELEGSAFLTRVMLAPDASVVKLRPLRRAGGATGLITISPRAGTAILEASGLPTNPPDFAYQLWWIAARRTPIKAAVFRVEGDRDAIVLANLPPKGVPLVAGAVTLEPAS